MGLLLIPLLIGILLSPCLDERFVWAAIPAALVTLTFSHQGFALLGSRFAPSPRARGWTLWLLVALIGAAGTSMVPAVPPIPEDTGVRVVGKLTKAPEWRGLGSCLGLELRTVGRLAYRGRAGLTGVLDE